ncbi:MAG: methyltransferase domain-containing protein [Bryobacteraceae bacterium]|nr:methyltransferase domain-containing protein [Bryobacteraceae bacterium]
MHCASPPSIAASGGFAIWRRCGGVERLTVARMDAQRLAFQPRSFDVVTILEVLEHLEDPLAALRGAVAAARRFVLLSAPSTPDRNPGHLRLFGLGELKELAFRAGAASCSVEHVLNHRIALCRVSG